MSQTYRILAPARLGAVPPEKGESFPVEVIELSGSGGRFRVNRPLQLLETTLSMPSAPGERCSIRLGHPRRHGAIYEVDFHLAGSKVWPFRLWTALSAAAAEDAAGKADCLATLGLEPGCTAEDVDRAFFRMVRQAHPDRGGTVERFTALRQAHVEALALFGRKR